MNTSSSSWVVRTGKVDEMKDRIARYQEEASASASATISRSLIKDDGEVLVELNDVNVSYHERKVSISGFFLQTTRLNFAGAPKHELEGASR